ncbi:MAG: MBL fold metallo-hydrolase [Solirubrobacterales bacterium]
MADKFVAESGGARVLLVRADNPGAMTLAGTNSYVVAVDGRCWVIDPGPDDARHLTALAEAARRLGSPAGVALTHEHGDHSEGVEPLRELLDGVPLQRFGEDVAGSPLLGVHTPGHSADHLVFLLGDVLFSGDLILGGSSTIVPPGGGTLAAYFESLAALADFEPRLILPGHGPPIEDAASAVRNQLEHRLARENALAAALDDGVRDREELLDRAWSDVPPQLRIAAHVTMQSHLEKLDIEGRLPDDFETDGRRRWGHR